MTVVLDTCGWIQYFGAGPMVDVYAPFVEAAEPPAVPIVVAFEVHRWALREVGEDLANQYAAAMAKNRLLVPNLGVALLAADLGVRHQLGACDALIYAAAQIEGFDVVTSDEDFKGLPGVQYFPHPAPARPSGSTRKSRRAARRM